MQHGLDRVRVFHTLFRHWVTPLAERTRPMWKYSGPTDPDHALPEEFPNDEVWSHVDWVLQLKPKENINGKPRPLNSSMVSKLVCSLSLLRVLFSFAFPLFLILSCLFYRGLKLTSPGRTFQRGQSVRLVRPPRRR